MLHFKTKEALLSADVTELASAGIPQRTAAELYAFLHRTQEEKT
jgi:ERCC4-type nuclease